MSLLTIPDSIYIGVTDAAAASDWYKEKFGLQQVLLSMENAEECISLAFSKRDETAIILGPRSAPTEAQPMLYASNIEKARDLLASRGVSVGPIEEDRQGTRHFMMRDLESNELEVTEDP